MQKRSLIESFNDAIEGFIYVLRTQRHMRIHFLFGISIFILGILLGFDRVELLILAIAIALVLISEMINTAVEFTMDLVSDRYNQTVKIIKDICAGVVLAAAINAFIAGYLLFGRQFFDHNEFDAGIARIRQSPWHITAIAVIVVISLVIIGKLLFHRGTPMRGGMPSGHAAFAFAVWTAIAFVTKNELAIFLVFFLALMVAQSRIIKNVHTAREVIMGSLLGILTTMLVFQLLR